MASDTWIPPPESADTWCRTSLVNANNVHRNFMCSHHTFAWTIERFLETRETTDDVIKSGTFRIKMRDTGKEEDVTIWQLVLLPKSVCLYPNDYIKVILVKKDGPDVRAHCLFSLVDANDVLLATVKTSRPFLFDDEIEKDDMLDIDDRKNNDLEYWLTRRFATLPWVEDMYDWVPEDNLTILCDVTVLHEACVSPKDTEEVDASTKRHRRSKKEKEMLASINHELNQQLEHTYRNGDFADVEVMCNTEVFKCHQFMLAARSPVLRAMFQSPMTEAATRRLEIKDLPPDMVDVMLLFIYTGNVPNLSEVAAELLDAAEKYQIDQLKDLCEQQLTETTDIGNAVSHLFLGDRFQAVGLRKVAMEFVVQHFKAVMANPEWKQRLIGHPALLAEITVEFLAGM